jgi:hypothetical protein
LKRTCGDDGKDDAMTNAEIDERQMREVQAVVDQVRRLMTDFIIEQKCLVVIEIDRWVSLEEATHAP